MGMILGEEPAGLFFVVLLLPLIDMQNLSHSVLTPIVRAELLEFLNNSDPSR